MPTLLALALLGFDAPAVAAAPGSRVERPAASKGTRRTTPTRSSGSKASSPSTTRSTSAPKTTSPTRTTPTTKSAPRSSSPSPSSSSASRPSSSRPTPAPAPPSPQTSAPTTTADRKPSAPASATSRPTPTPTPTPTPAPSAPIGADRLSGSLQATPSPRATHPTTRAQNTIHGADVRRLDVAEPRPVSSLRPFDATRPGDASRPGNAGRPDARPPHRSDDVRYARPASHRVRPPPYAHTRVPVLYTYRPWYSRWYCHPWYRYRYSTWAVVSFGFGVYAWNDRWIPPARWGWMWMPGFWSWGYWHPGYWAPVSPGPIGYLYVPGWWEDDVYVEGYYRTDARDGWEWIEGYYLDDGTYTRGHWMPTGPAPEGYLWEPGFWDGEQYVDGFWRPQFRKGFLWVSAFYDAEGIFHSGYWMPAEERPGHEWIPGWFDGNEWQPGYWVERSEIEQGAIDDFEPPEGYDEGWDEVEAPPVAAPGETPEVRLIERYRDRTGEDPLAVPVVIPEEGG